MEMRIRKFTESDYQNLYDTISDPDVMSYIEPPYSAEKTKAFLFKAGLCDNPQIFAAENDEGNYVGYVIYHDYDETSKEIGWVLKKEIWGQGMASLLTKQLIALAASEGKDAVIECVPEQAATKAIAGKHGFQKAGERDGLEIYRRKRE